jgi:hypothetical protein
MRRCNGPVSASFPRVRPFADRGFPRPMRETMTTGEISFRNAWLPVFVDRAVTNVVDRVDDRTIWRVVVAGHGRRPVFALLCGNGAPERIRTSDPQIRSLVLYPAELRAPCGPVGGGGLFRSRGGV